MEIIGKGFLAHNLAPLAEHHPHVTVLAAGVSGTTLDAPAEFRREEELMHATVERCRHQGRLVVFFSSASHAVYGSPQSPAEEDLPAAPSTPYGRHKLVLEEHLRDSGTGWLTLRLGHALGPGQRSYQLLPSLVRQLQSGLIRVFRGAHRDLIDVRDVMASLNSLLAARVRNEIVNVASGTAYAIEDIIDGVEARLGYRATRIPVTMEPNRTVVSVEKLRRLAPEACPQGGQAYLDALLDRYVPEVAAMTAITEQRLRPAWR